jgi:hypothetical protein
MAGACFFVPQGAEDNGIGRHGDRIGRDGDVPEDFEGAIGPGVEVWLDAAFESEQATGKPVCAGGDRQVMTEVVVPEGGVMIKYGRGWHRHQMCKPNLWNRCGRKKTRSGPENVIDRIG